MADVLGLTIETVSRSLTRLKRDRIIAIPGLRRLTILQPEVLATIASG
jgi:CRP/FNR family transcriptional regulator